MILWFYVPTKSNRLNRGFFESLDAVTGNQSLKLWPLVYFINFT